MQRNGGIRMIFHKFKITISDPNETRCYGYIVDSEIANVNAALKDATEKAEDKIDYLYPKKNQLFRFRKSKARIKCIQIK